jgi:predicted RND superfamily exporter protein
VVWLGGILGWLDIKLNVLNFIAVPITLGVGVDYAANIWARLREGPASRLVEVVADTGSAVALCSMTTIIGYSTLLMSRNHALRSFGLVEPARALLVLARRAFLEMGALGLVEEADEGLARLNKPLV